MSLHALDVFNENATKMVWLIKQKKWGPTVKVAPKLCIFLYNTMQITGIRQVMGVMHSDVMDIFFYSGDAWKAML